MLYWLATNAALGHQRADNDEKSQLIPTDFLIKYNYFEGDPMAPLPSGTPIIGSSLLSMVIKGSTNFSNF